MKSFLTKTLSLVFLGLGFVLNTQGQDLIVNLLSGQTEAYPVNEIQRIRFFNNSMVLYQNNENTIAWDIADIMNYEFDASSLSALDVRQDESNPLKIYPNPSSERVQIEYIGSACSELLIEVFDQGGKRITVLYRGGHVERTRVNWDLRSAGIVPGSYFCRVTDASKVVTGKIIVQ